MNWNPITRYESLPSTLFCRVYHGWVPPDYRCSRCALIKLVPTWHWPELTFSKYSGKNPQRAPSACPSFRGSIIFFLFCVCRIYLCKQWHLVRSFQGICLLLIFAGSSTLCYSRRSFWVGDRGAFRQECLVHRFSGDGSHFEVFWISRKLNYTIMIVLHQTGLTCTTVIVIFLSRKTFSSALDPTRIMAN